MFSFGDLKDYFNLPSYFLIVIGIVMIIYCISFFPAFSANVYSTGISLFGLILIVYALLNIWHNSREIKNTFNRLDNDEKIVLTGYKLIGSQNIWINPDPDAVSLRKATEKLKTRRIIVKIGGGSFVGENCYILDKYWDRLKKKKLLTFDIDDVKDINILNGWMIGMGGYQAIVHNKKLIALDMSRINVKKDLPKEYHKYLVYPYVSKPKRK